MQNNNTETHWISLLDGRYCGSVHAVTADEAFARTVCQASHPAHRYSVITETQWNAARAQARREGRPLGAL